ncbi:MAG: N-acetylmuramoyl-L-alanine amidase [Alphaproteobacteria bacterium]
MQIDDIPSPNFDARAAGGPIDILLLHYTGMPSAADALERLCTPEVKVSAHYLIDEGGRITRLVAEDRRAWHAGVSSWAGATDINSRSIGIELANPGHEFGYRPFPSAQMQALVGLAHDIMSRHPIPARRVLGHSDVAPTRKLDPGELFDWPYLAARGIGAWPATALVVAPPAASEGPALLAAYGYDIADPVAAVRAFQRHFRPDRIDGAFDSETLLRLAALSLMDR